MKRCWLIAVFFCIVHKASQDIAIKYEGMSRKDVKTLIQKTYGVPFDFVDEQKYNAFLSAHEPASKLFKNPLTPQNN